VWHTLLAVHGWEGLPARDFSAPVRMSCACLCVAVWLVSRSQLFLESLEISLAINEQRAVRTSCVPAANVTLMSHTALHACG
jgi:hypothetical protein